jgi:hypothetical protein
LDWKKPLEDGPQDIGFDSSLISIGGIQSPPYIFLRDGIVENASKIKYWNKGKYIKPLGQSIINIPGEGSRQWDSTAYNMILVNETARFVDEHLDKREKQPFFAYIALGNVHIPHSPPRHYMDGSKVKRKYPSRHMDMLGEMDKVVGSLLKILEERSILEDTLVIFASDNGGLGNKYSSKYGHNSHGPLTGIKGSIFEGGHRIPLFMRWDNGPIPAGENRHHLIGLNDLFATICDLIGVKVPEGQAKDSISFAKYIQDATSVQNLREELGVWTYHNKILMEESIRSGNLKLIRNRHSNAVALYDLASDISETTDLANLPAYKKIVDEMLLLLGTISPCHDNSNNFWIKEDKTMKEVDCKWFQKGVSRCKNYPEGQLECRLTCAGINKSSCEILESTFTPSTSPISSLTNQPSESLSRQSSPEPSVLQSSLVPSTLSSNSPSINLSERQTSSPSLSPAIKFSERPSALASLEVSNQPSEASTGRSSSYPTQSTVPTERD